MFLIKTKRHKASLFTLLSVSLLLACFAFLTTSITPAHAVTTVPTTMNFQGRLSDSSGNIMPDGLYNMQFRLFTVGSGGSSVWNETRENNGTDYRVQVTNGLFSTKLGQVSPLTASLFASGSLYFEITMATPATATCATASCASWESPMTPRHQLSTSAYAYNAETLDGYDSSYFATATGASGYIQNTTTPQTADFNITGTGTANILRATTFDRATAGTLTVGGTNATSISLADNTTLAAGNSLTVVGGNTASRPASPTEGMVYYDTTTKQLLTYANGKWQADSAAATFIVAASNSSQAAKDGANYVANGEDSAGAGIGTLDGDQIEINQALTAAAAAGGGTVYLTEGTYTVDASISIPDNVTLAGSGFRTIVQLGNFGATLTDINAITNTNQTTGTGVVIRDIKLDGRKAINGYGTQYGIVWNNMGGGTGSTARKGGYLSSVYVTNFGASIVLESSSNNTITGNTVQGNTNYGIHISTSSNNNTITGNTVQGNSYIGIYLNTSSNNTITSNTMQGNNYAGIQLSTSSNNNTITGNTVQGNSIGIYLTTSSNNTITGNTISETNSSGISMSSANNNTINGNSFYDNGGLGNNNAINLSSSDKNNITGNSITDTSATTTNYAINISNSTSDTNYLADNHFSSTPGTSTIRDLGTGTVYSNQPTAENGGNITTKSSQAATYVATIQNTSTATTADGLLISLGVANASRTTGNYFVGFASGTTVAGKIQGGASAVAYTTTGADYAEYFKADPQAMPQSGELVMLDASSSQSVVRTNGNTQRPLAGIVSTSPGFIGNGPICEVDDEDCDANYAKYNALVALSGQVSTKVNTSNGAIAIGDPITASNVAGEGAKATSAGHIVGYALEPLNSGSGTIQVLVRPQHYAPAMSQVLQATDLTLTGQASISGGLNVSGPTTLNSLTVTDAVTIKGKLTVDTIEAGSITVNGHIVTKGSAPTIAIGDAAGTGLAGDESTNPQAVVDGTDSAGTVTVTAGAENVNSGVLAKITFAEAYEADVKVVVSASNESASEIRTYTVKTATGFEIVAKDQLQAGAEYAFDYIVQGVNVVP